MKTEHNEPLLIEKCLFISVLHVKGKTLDMLTKEDFPIIAYPKMGWINCGWWLHLPDEYPEEKIPEDLGQCIRLARDNGCNWLCLDTDGPVIDGLDIFSS